MRSRLIFSALLSAFLLASCGQEKASNPTELTVVTHDSFALADSVIADFEAQTGISVQIVKSGDAGAMVSQLVLTKADPLGDVVFGIDNTFASRAIENEVLLSYKSPNSENGAAKFNEVGDSLTAVDYGDVCFNADLAWFAQADLELPKTFADLAKPEYRDLTVISNPATSSPGLAFLAATVSEFGVDGYAKYWTDLVANGVEVVAGWEEAYFTSFSGSAGAGPRPIVLSYSSSPAAEIREDGNSGTVALLETCTRQTEFVGILNGTDNQVGAQQFIDYLLTAEVQETLPSTMYVYPVTDGVQLPVEWAKFAPVATKAQLRNLPSAEFESNRENWLQTIAPIIGQ